MMPRVVMLARGPLVSALRMSRPVRLPAVRMLSLSGCPPRGIDPRPLAVFPLPLTDLSDALRHRHFECLGSRGVVEIGNGDARKTPPNRPLDVAEAPFFFG